MIYNIEFWSAVFGLVGGVILAFSLDRVLVELHLGIEFLATSIESIATKTSPIYVFTGLDERWTKAERISRRLVRVGLICLVISAALAVWGIYKKAS